MFQRDGNMIGIIVILCFNRLSLLQYVSNGSENVQTNDLPVDYAKISDVHPFPMVETLDIKF